MGFASWLFVAAFYGEVMEMMRSVDMPLEIYTTPSEIADAIPFPRDDQHATYDAEQARALFRALLQANRVFTRFRCGFLGKASPVHFFWGSFDLAVTRFSGRTAPPHPGGMPNFADDIAREAYSHEVTSVGFWPGNRETPTPIFYAYAYPTPDGYSDASVSPDTAFWLEQLGEFALPYDAVRSAADLPPGTRVATSLRRGGRRRRSERSPEFVPRVHARRGRRSARLGPVCSRVREPVRTRLVAHTRSALSSAERCGPRDTACVPNVRGRQSTATCAKSVPQ